jgi:hypothetical protein
MKMQFPSRLAVVVPLLLASACATISVGADFEPGVRLDRYRTFGWDVSDAMPIGDPRLDNNPFFDSRVRSAVELELATKGLRLVTTSPDLLIHYHASVQHRVDVVKRDTDRGYTSPQYGQADTIVAFDEGTLLLDVADAATKRILWRGWAQTDVSGLIERPRDMEKRIRESMRLMIKALPRTP